MNKLYPTNSIRCIKGEVCGIKRLSANPAMKAPTIGSILANSTRKAAKKTSKKRKASRRKPAKKAKKRRR